MKYSHEALADFFLANPTAYAKEAAAVFRRSQAWVTTVIQSDAFRAIMAKRKEELVNPAIRLSIEERIRGLVTQSLDVLGEKLEQPGVKAEVALRAFELGSKAMGIGGNAPAAPAEDSLNRLAERLVALQSTVRKGQTYEAVPIEAESPRHAQGE
jgi:hypothetical protein